MNKDDLIPVGSRITADGRMETELGRMTDAAILPERSPRKYVNVAEVVALGENRLPEIDEEFPVRFSIGDYYPPDGAILRMCPFVDYRRYDRYERHDIYIQVMSAARRSLERGTYVLMCKRRYGGATGFVIPANTPTVEWAVIGRTPERPQKRRSGYPYHYGPDDWSVTLNGIRISPDMVTAADSVEGWVDVIERNPRHEGGRVLVHNGVIFKRRLYGGVVIRYRGIPLLRWEAQT